MKKFKWYMRYKCQFGRETLKMVGPKEQAIWPRINQSKDFFLKSQKTKIELSKSIFDAKNWSNFFKKKYLKISMEETGS